MDEKKDSNVVETGVDLSEFYMSVEWDIIEVPAIRYENTLAYIKNHRRIIALLVNQKNVL